MIGTVEEYVDIEYADEFTKLSGIEVGAEVNAIDTIKVNGSTQTIHDKVVDITVPVSNVDFEPKSNTVTTFNLTLDSSTYVMTLVAKNSSGIALSTATIDLPLESVVVSGSYDSTNKKIILTLQNGSTIEFSVADLVSGLVPDSRTIAGVDLQDNITAQELITGLGIGGTIKPITSDSNIYSLDDGVYKVGSTGSIKLYYNSTQYKTIIGNHYAIMLVTTYGSNSYKTYWIFEDGGYYYGTAKASGGDINEMGDGFVPGTRKIAGVNLEDDITKAELQTAIGSFTGTNGSVAGSTGLVPAPATTDANKYLKSDGTWGTISQSATRFKLYELTSTDVYNDEEVTDTTDSNTLDEMLADIKDNDILGILKVPSQNTYTYYIAQFISVYNNKYRIDLVGNGTQFLTFYQGNTYWQIQATTMFNFLPYQFSVGLVDVDWTDTTTQTISTQDTIDELDDIQNNYSFDDIIYVYDINSNDTEAKLDNVSYEIDSMTGDYTLCGLVNIEDTTYRLQLISSEGDWTAKVAEVFTGGNEIATTIDSTSTNSEVAGAKAVYDIIGNVELILQTLNSGSGV